MRYISATITLREECRMILAEEFLRHAADCERMAKFTHDHQNKSVWSGMAERWVRCAELAKKHSPAVRSGDKVKGQRKPAGGRSH
jgi:hypothetical protein